MDLTSACDILGIDMKDTSQLRMKNVKKKYHKLALHHHPDKNGGTKEKFQEINEAFDYIKREMELADNTGENSDDSDSSPSSSSSSSYSFFLNLFIDGLLHGKYNASISEVIKNIVNGCCNEITIKLFDGLDKERATVIYTFLSNYKDSLHIGDDILDKVREIIVDKYKGLQIFVLNPTITDLFEHNVYKLCIDDTIFFVPLWHNEMIFDFTKNKSKHDEKDEKGEKHMKRRENNEEIIVRCLPDLPDNVSIDENNNIFVEIKTPFSSLSLDGSNPIVILLGKKTFTIPTNQLYIKERQNVVFKKMGIPKINDSCSVDDKADVIVSVIFTF